MLQNDIAQLQTYAEQMGFILQFTFQKDIWKVAVLDADRKEIDFVFATELDYAAYVILRSRKNMDSCKAMEEVK